MRKPITVLSVLSVVFAIISLVLTFAVLTFFWEPVCMIYSSSEEAACAGPVLPIGKILYILGCLAISVVLLCTAKTKRFIVIEIIPMALLSVVLPILAWLFERIQGMWTAPMGTEYILRLTIASKSLYNPVSFMKLSSALCLVVCGMRIAEKIKKGKMNDSMLK